MLIDRGAVPARDLDHLRSVQPLLRIDRARESDERLPVSGKPIGPAKTPPERMLHQTPAFGAQLLERRLVVLEQKKRSIERQILALDVTLGGGDGQRFPADGHRSVLAPLHVDTRAQAVLRASCSAGSPPARRRPWK